MRNVRMKLTGRFKVGFAALVLIVALWGGGLSGVASAHGEGEWESLYDQHVAVGPYDVTIHYSSWPVQAMTSQRFIIEVEGGIEGRSGQWKWVPAEGVYGSEIGFYPLHTYPGTEGVWVLEVPGIPAPGDWRFAIKIDGPLGAGTGESDPFTVSDPPGFPMWLGWLIGLFPLYGLVWFGLREWRRVRTQFAQDEALRA